jgi:hypothetical protein
VRQRQDNGYDPVIYAAQTLFCLTNGRVSLADAERLDEDTSFKELLGLKKCPDKSALGQWLRQARAAGGVEAVRTNIPERRQKGRCWTDKPVAQEKAFRAGRRRVRGKKGRQLNRPRSERCERTFAHVWETGGGRRTWLRGKTNVSKAHTLKCAAYNLGVLLRKVWGMRKPRNADEGIWAAFWPVGRG